MREADPEIATGFIFDHAVALPAPGKATPLFPPVDGICPRRDLVEPGLLEQAAAAGLAVHVWTVDEEPEMRRLITAGVASLITNLPDLGLTVRGAVADSAGELAARPAGRIP
jgi:glycerophosphoryl diester phosphodiesterase